MTSLRRSPARIAAFVAFGAIALGAPVLGPAAAGAGGGSTTVSVPDSIDASGGTDVTDALQDFLATVANGSTIAFPEGAQYRVDGSIGINGKRNLTVDGNGATVFATTEGERNRTQLNIVDSTRVVVRDLVVKGANPAGGVGDAAYKAELEAQHGINIIGSVGIELDGVTVTDVYGDFVYIGQRRGTDWSRKIWIHDSTFARNGRQGIAVTAGREIVFERNTIGDTRRATIDLEPNNTQGGAEDVFILDNTVGQGRLRFVASHGRGRVDDITISGNRLDGIALTVDVVAPGDTRRTGWWVGENSSTKESDRTPLLFTRVDEVVVRNNIQPVEQRDGNAGAGLRDVCGATVEANEFGPGVPQFSVGGTECAAAASVAEPEPPTIRGRDPESRVQLPIGTPGGATTVPGSTATTVRPPATTAPLESAAADDDDGTDVMVYVIGGALVLAVAGIVVGLVVRARRSRSHRYYRSYE
jgi:hypothetical protein